MRLPSVLQQNLEVHKPPFEQIPSWKGEPVLRVCADRGNTCDRAKSWSSPCRARPTPQRACHQPEPGRHVDLHKVCVATGARDHSVLRIIPQHVSFPPFTEILPEPETDLPKSRIGYVRRESESAKNGIGLGVFSLFGFAEETS